MIGYLKNKHLREAELFQSFYQSVENCIDVGDEQLNKST